MKGASPYTRHQDAMRHIRTEMFGGQISYQRVADVLTQHAPERVNKSQAWNAENLPWKCQAHIKAALVEMGLLRVKKRWRFFFEVDEKTYQKISEFLGDRTFTQYMEEEEQPWD